MFILNLFLKKAKVHIGDFKILETGLHKIIKCMKKNKLEPRLDSIKENQVLSLLENTNHFIKCKNMKQKLISNPKLVIKPILLKKLLF